MRCRRIISRLYWRFFQSLARMGLDQHGYHYLFFRKLPQQQFSKIFQSSMGRCNQPCSCWQDRLASVGQLHPDLAVFVGCMHQSLVELIYTSKPQLAFQPQTFQATFFEETLNNSVSLSKFASLTPYRITQCRPQNTVDTSGPSRYILLLKCLQVPCTLACS